MLSASGILSYNCKFERKFQINLNEHQLQLLCTALKEYLGWAIFQKLKKRKTLYLKQYF